MKIKLFIFYYDLSILQIFIQYDEFFVAIVIILMSAVYFYNIIFLEIGNFITQKNKQKKLNFLNYFD